MDRSTPWQTALLLCFSSGSGIEVPVPITSDSWDLPCTIISRYQSFLKLQMVPLRLPPAALQQRIIREPNKPQGQRQHPQKIWPQLYTPKLYGFVSVG